MRRRCAISLLAVVALTPWLHAQMRGTAIAGRPSARMSAPRSFSRPGLASNSVAGRPAFDRRYPHHQFFLGAPLFYSDDIYPDYTSSPAVPPEPQVVVVQTPAPAREEPVRSAAPLLIEWQGDHYARVSEENRPAPAESALQVSQPPASRAREELRPATLVFRDGTRREVGSYTIVDGVLYANSDYWTSGSWTQPIQLSQLDIPATLESNQQRGVKFLLPSGPNEVVTRP